MLTFRLATTLSLSAIGAVVASGFVVEDDDYWDASSSVVSAPILGMEAGPYLVSCGNCSQEDCDPEEHRFTNFLIGGEAPDRAYDERDHGCEEGWCSAAHPYGQGCASEESDVDTIDEFAAAALWEVTMSNDQAALEALTLDAGTGVFVNVDRGALQVLACDGSVNVSIPLSSGQLDGLRRAIAER